jgi:hypothetical protein
MGNQKKTVAANEKAAKKKGVEIAAGSKPIKKKGTGA